MQEHDRLRLMVQVSKMYYEQGMTQDQVAQVCQIDRSRVSRLITQARQEGFIQIQVLDPFSIDSNLTQKLKIKYELEDIIICDSIGVPERELKKVIGMYAANFLLSVLKDGDIFAVSWGETIYHTVKSLSPPQPLKITVVPSVGGSGLISPAYQINDLVQEVARAFGAEAKTLYAPAFVNSAEAKSEFIASKDIQMIQEYWKKATVALVGLGKAPQQYEKKHESDLIFGEFYLKPDELEEIRSSQVVGDINARFINRDGDEQDLIVHSRTISMTLQELKHCRKVIGVAGGLSKVEVIRAALTGNQINALITDSLTAMKLLEN